MIADHAQNHGLKTALLGINKVGQVSYSAVGLIRNEFFNLPDCIAKLLTGSDPQTQYQHLNRQVLNDTGLPIGYRLLPLAILDATQEQSQRFPKTLKSKDENSNRAFQIEPSELSQKIPQLRETIASSIYYPARAIIDTQLLCDAIALKLTKHGGWVNRNLHTTAPVYDKNRVIGVKSIQGDNSWHFHSNHVVVATGIWSSELLPETFEIPLIQNFAHTLTMPNNTNLSSAITQNDLTIIPLDSDEILVTFIERPMNTNILPKIKLHQKILNAVKKLIPPQDINNIIDHSTSRLSALPDGLPIVGNTETEGLQIATGHDLLGITLAGETAKLIVKNILSEKPNPLGIHLSPLRYLRHR